MTMRHKGREIRAHKIRLTNTGDGLSQAVNVDPPDLDIDEECYALIKCKKTKETFEPVKEGSADLELVHVLRGGAATLIPESVAEPMIAEQTERIIAARDEAVGASQLSNEAARLVEHDQGLHKRRRKGCPGCYPASVDEDFDPLNVGGKK